MPHRRHDRAVSHQELRFPKLRSHTLCIDLKDCLPPMATRFQRLLPPTDPEIFIQAAKLSPDPQHSGHPLLDPTLRGLSDRYLGASTTTYRTGINIVQEGAQGQERGGILPRVLHQGRAQGITLHHYDLCQVLEQHPVGVAPQEYLDCRQGLLRRGRSNTECGQQRGSQDCRPEAAVSSRVQLL